MAAVFTEWGNRNELRNYPLNDAATKVDAEGNFLPDDILADLNLMVPASAGEFVFVSSVFISPSLVSVTFLASSCDPFDPDCTPSSVLVPLAALTVRKPVAHLRNYAVDALYPGVGGWVAFGSGVEEIDNITLRFLDPKATLLLPRAARAYDDLPVESIGKAQQTAALTGLVSLTGEPGVIRVRKAIKTILGRKREVVAIGLNLDSDPAGTLRKYTGPCGGRPEDRTCAGRSLVSMNGVGADCRGNLNIRFEGLDATLVGIEDGTVVDLPIGLEDVCSDIDPTRFDPSDLCATDEPLSSSSLSSSSQSLPSEVSSSSSSPAGGAFCSSFDSGAVLAAFQTVEGSFAVQPVEHGPVKQNRTTDPQAGLEPPPSGWTDTRLVSRRGALASQVILHRDIELSGDAGYTIEALIRPASERGNGHVIFGYKNINDFFFAGISTDSLEAASSGVLYVGHRTTDRGSILDNFPLGLGQGYVFDQAGAPSTDFGAGSPPPLGEDGIFNADLRLIVTVGPPVPGSALRLVQASFSWDTSAFGVPESVPVASIAFATSLSDLDGKAGMGVVASETEFDNFGINCGSGYTPGQSTSYSPSAGSWIAQNVDFPWPGGEG